jgi:predicted TIM-barrel fold metal-dependent hydrolase
MAPPKVIAIEEHFTTPEIVDFRGDQDRTSPIAKGLEDLADLRIRQMDEAGIDLQILSENAPATQNFEPEAAVRLARRSNDLLHEAVRAHPTRFAGFATLPTPDPKAAADELERAVTKLGFKGGMFMGLSRGRFLDEKEFWPIYERAQALDVPLYFHPALPHPAVMEAYFKDYPGMGLAACGFTIETLTQIIRLVPAGVFDAYPKLKIIIGHLGEALPFLLWRTDNSLQRVVKLPRPFPEYVRDHYYITTSGAFADTPLQCSITEFGIDKILFAVDWPYQSNKVARDWLDKAPISDGDRELIFSGNARRLLKL